MMYDAFLAWRGLRARPVQTMIPIVALALALGLSILVLALGDAARRGIVQAADPFGALVVGPKGDAEQLVLNTILLQGLPLGVIPRDIYDRLEGDPRVRLAVPLAFGDNIGNAPVIGTSAAFFQLRTEQYAPPAFQVVEGRLFSGDFEAVLGSRAAAQLGLSIGDTFRAAHGVEAGLEDDVHAQVYTVVGVLGPSGTAYDGAVLVTMETVWNVHAPGGDAGSPLIIDGLGAPDGLTAVLVQANGFAEQNRIWQEFYAGTEAQAAFPGQSLGALFDLLRQGERLLTLVGYLVFFIAALTVFLSVYSATQRREREIAIMRAVGGGRRNIVRLVLFESLLLVLVGSLLGRVLGYGVALIVANGFSVQSSIPLPVRWLGGLEPVLWLLPLAAALLAGLIPALLAYRVNVVDGLTAPG
jgi:putative ABC transport system permease protein